MRTNCCIFFAVLEEKTSFSTKKQLSSCLKKFSAKNVIYHHNFQNLKHIFYHILDSDLSERIRSWRYYMATHSIRWQPNNTWHVSSETDEYYRSYWWRKSFPQGKTYFLIMNLHFLEAKLKVKSSSFSEVKTQFPQARYYFPKR